MDSSTLAYPIAGLSLLLISVSAYLLYAKSRDNTAAPKQAARVSIDDARDVIRVMFGTQTGTAEKFAKQLATQLNERYGEGAVFKTQDIESYDHDSRLGNERMLLYLAATYGDGEPTDNAVQFHEWLGPKADAVFAGDDEEPLLGTPYAVFGLGNKTYEHYNAMGKHIHKHLATLGGASIVPLGLGDDDADIADDFEVWVDTLIKAIDAKALLHQSSAARTGATQAKVGYTVELHDAANGVATNGKSAATNGKARANDAVQNGKHDIQPEPWVAGAEKHVPVLATVAAVRELHSSGSERSCVHAEVSLTGTGMSYEHGDHIALYPRNSAATVTAACAALRWDPTTRFSLSIPPCNPEMLPEPFVCPTTVATALAHYCELLQHPDKACLLLLAACADDEGEAARLRRLGGHEGKQEFAEWIVASKRSLIEVLEEFRSVEVPMGLFFAHVAPPLRPRYYSISSSPLRHAAAAHVTAAVVDERTSAGRRHLGVATSMLAQLPAGARLPAFIRKSSFRLPADPKTPVVMVGPGTGLAPFRGFLQQRRALRDGGAALGPALLFFGCRDPDKDYIYRDELKAARDDGVVTLLATAFSRVTASKEYVQHRMREHRCDVFEALQAGGTLYVCGDAKHMARDVHKAMLEIAAGCNGWKGHEAEEWLAQLQREGRYLQDVW